MSQKKVQKIIIVDFGSQVTQLIARQIRELGVYCELINYKLFNSNQLIESNVKGIVLSSVKKVNIISLFQIGVEKYKTNHHLLLNYEKFFHFLVYCPFAFPAFWKYK